MSEPYAAPAPGWWSRNWKWVVPAGCGCFVLCAAGIVAAIFFGVSSLMRSSDVAEGALQRARANDAAIAALGEPIEMRGLPSGNIDVKNGGGHADFTVTVHGPKAHGRMHIVAERLHGSWDYSRIEVTVGDQVIDVLEHGPGISL